MRKLTILFAALTLCAGLWAQDSTSKSEAIITINQVADDAIAEIQNASSVDYVQYLKDKARNDINGMRDFMIAKIQAEEERSIGIHLSFAINEINKIKDKALADIEAAIAQHEAENTIDTIRIYNDILIIDEVYNPKTMQVIGWSYNSHDDEELYTFIRTNTTEKFGTFSFENHTIDTVGNYNIVEFITRQDTVNATFIEGQMTVAEIGDSIILDGEFKGDDGKVYLFHCTHLTAALNADTDMDIEQEYEYYDMFSYIENGVATIELENIEATVTLELYVGSATDIPAGTYQLSTTHEAGTAHLSTGVERFDPQPCYAGTMDTLTGQIRDFFFMTEGSITIRYNEYGKMNVEVNTKNSYNRNCHLTVTHHHVEPIDTITIEEDVDFAMAVDRIRPQFYACQIFEHQELFAVFLIRTRDISGDFSKEICLPSGVIHAHDGYYRSIVDFEQCTVAKEEKDMTIETRFIANDSILYIIRATGYEDAIIGDSKNDYERDFLIEDISWRQNKGDTCIFYAESSITGDHIKFAFLANFREDSTIIPDTYTGIIPGGDWVLGEGALPSCIENAVGMWYIQSGMMTVNEDGSMAFEGLNSYDKKVVFTIAAKGTDLINVNENVNVNKFLHNGQLLIRKNGKTYNVLGTRL